MSARVLIVERDAPGRTMMARVLESTGLSATGVTSSREVEETLDRGGYDVAIVDELAGGGAVLDEIRTMRARWPRVPVIATGTLLSQRVLIELMRLGCVDALPKPFVPQELREAVERSITRGSRELVAEDWAAAVASAREALGSGDVPRARSSLRRAQALVPLDPEVIALDALLAELVGDDARAEELYRVALVLRHDESTVPSPAEGLARLAAYAGAPIVDTLPDDARPTRFAVGLGGEHRVLRRSGDRTFVTTIGSSMERG